MKPYLKPYLKRFSTLTKDDLKVDFQIHTTFTDGSHAPQEIIAAAEDQGLKAIAFTEHIRSDSTYYPEFIAHIDQLRSKSSLDIFVGVETKVLDEKGSLDISPADQKRAQIILGSVHRINDNGALIHPRDLGEEKTLAKEFQLSMAMVNAGAIDVLAHPLGMGLRMFNVFSKDNLTQLIKRIAETDIAFELSGKYTQPLFLKEIIELCYRYDPVVSIGSDVHKIEELGRSRRMLEPFYA
jgi:putative hydrolase